MKKQIVIIVLGRVNVKIVKGLEKIKMKLIVWNVKLAGAGVSVMNVMVEAQNEYSIG